MADLSVDVRSEQEMKELGRAFGALLRPGDTVLLDGPIGAGKSVFVRAVVHGLGVTDHVPSPTFALAFSYRAEGLVIVHADAYRLDDPQEYADLALEESYDDAAVLVEWGSRVASVVSDDHLRILIEPVDDRDPDARTVRFVATTDDWKSRLPALAVRS